jgi:hypothetical protein
MQIVIWVHSNEDAGNRFSGSSRICGPGVHSPPGTSRAAFPRRTGHIREPVASMRRLAPYPSRHAIDLAR